MKPELLNDRLEDLLTLHSEITIFYTVDGYQAELIINDGKTVKLSVHGTTVLEALGKL